VKFSYEREKGEGRVKGRREWKCGKGEGIRAMG